MIEDAREQRLLLAERVEVRRLARRADVAGARVLAVDRFLGDQRLEPARSTARGDVEQLPRARPRRIARPASAASTFMPVST